LNNKATVSLDEIQKKHKKVDELAKNEKRTSFWTLLIMAIVSFLIFLAMVFIIMADRMIFGRSN